MAISPIKRFFHLNVVCRDFDTSVDFYTNVVGMHVFEGPFNLGPQYGPTDLGCVAQGSQMWGVDPSEVECRFALLRFGHEENEMMLDLLEWVKPRSFGSPNPTALHVGVARVALWLDDIHQAYDEMVARGDRKIVVSGKSVSVCVDFGSRRIHKK